MAATAESSAVAISPFILRFKEIIEIVDKTLDHRFRFKEPELKLLDSFFLEMLKLCEEPEVHDWIRSDVKTLESLLGYIKLVHQVEMYSLIQLVSRVFSKMQSSKGSVSEIAILDTHSKIPFVIDLLTHAIIRCPSMPMIVLAAFTALTECFHQSFEACIYFVQMKNEKNEKNNGLDLIMYILERAAKAEKTTVDKEGDAAAAAAAGGGEEEQKSGWEEDMEEEDKKKRDEWSDTKNQSILRIAADDLISSILKSFEDNNHHSEYNNMMCQKLTHLTRKNMVLEHFA